jgi:hypothetical protein
MPGATATTDAGVGMGADMSGMAKSGGGGATSAPTNGGNLMGNSPAMGAAAANAIAGTAAPTNGGTLAKAGATAFADEAEMKDLYHMAKKHPDLMAQMYVNRMDSTRRIS